MGTRSKKPWRSTAVLPVNNPGADGAVSVHGHRHSPPCLTLAPWSSLCARRTQCLAAAPADDGIRGDARDDAGVSSTPEFAWSRIWSSLWPMFMMLFGIYFPEKIAFHVRRPWLKYLLLVPCATLTLASVRSWWLVQRHQPGPHVAPASHAPVPASDGGGHDRHLNVLRERGL